MGLQLLLDPRCLRMITLDALGEVLSIRDPFVAGRKRSVSDLGESPYFHYLSPDERRELIGFPPPAEALRRDLGHLAGPWGELLPRPTRFRFENRKWGRILLLSRFVHIPSRSLHMLHFAAAYARRRGCGSVNLIVGETHNTDMRSFAAAGEGMRESLGPREREMFERVVRRAERFGGASYLRVSARLMLLRARYLLMILAGAATAAALYVLVGLLLVRAL
jgi:hypothetical protein